MVTTYMLLSADEKQVIYYYGRLKDARKDAKPGQVILTLKGPRFGEGFHMKKEVRK